ncbi:unnamed protein product [Dimorphilus gyrociliatus]|uniref:Uncharacterized protein n=1 Tax=Dimorphilus gyrociliatus TaxID=2664684 RepID=A0A7I8VVB9_9ANNE|nr:unnamed protein product [Dimorphilus gyrociliatus]
MERTRAISSDELILEHMRTKRVVGVMKKDGEETPAYLKRVEKTSTSSEDGDSVLKLIRDSRLTKDIQERYLKGASSSIEEKDDQDLMLRHMRNNGVVRKSIEYISNLSVPSE